MRIRSNELFVILICAGIAAILWSPPSVAQCGPRIVQKLLASDGDEYHSFGHAVAISGDAAIIGAPGDDTHGRGTGAVYFFERTSENEWIEVSKHLASDARGRSGFGRAVAISGDVAIVAGSGIDYQRGDSAGSVYVFSRSEKGAWSESGKLFPTAARAPLRFGESVAICGSTVVVGAPGSSFGGSAFIYEQDSQDRWRPVARIRPSDQKGGSYFGGSLAIDGDALIIGAPRDSEMGENAGAAYIFRKDDDGRWIEVAKLTASDAEPDESFGRAVAIRGNHAVIGAPLDPYPPRSTGSAYVFEDDGSGNWMEVTKLRPRLYRFRNFGKDTAISGGSVFVMADWELGAPRRKRGSTYLYRKDGAGNWLEVTKIAVANRFSQLSGADALAVSGDTAILGAPIDFEQAYYAGAAFIFDLNCAGEAAGLIDFEITTGELIDGELSDLRQSDNRRLETRSGLGSSFDNLHNMTLLVDAITTLDDAATLDITIESSITEPNGLARVGLFNWKSGSFDEIGAFPVGEREESVTIEDIPVADYIDESGAIQLSLQHVVFVPFVDFTFESFIDEVNILVN